MADPSEVTLLRSAREQDPDRPAPRRVRKTAAAAEEPAGKKPKAEPPASPQPDDRIRHITAVLIELSAVLLLLALVSYTAHDQANADVGVRDLFGLMSNDPVVAARADTTENWLGLLGAFISNFLINGTVGYMTLALPVLMGLWGVAVYRGGEYARETRVTSYAALLMTLVASIFGTIQLVSWMPHPSHEWSGSIGAFIATLLSGLLGTAGATLILLAAVGIALVYAFNLDVREIVARLRVIAANAREHAANARRVIAEKTVAPPAETELDGVPAPTSIAPRPSRREAMRPQAEELIDGRGDVLDVARKASPRVMTTERADPELENEPARMMRRMRTPADEVVEPRVTPEPKVRRPEPPPMPMFETTPPPPVEESPRRGNPVEDVPFEPAGTAAARRPLVDEYLERAMPDARRDDAGVTITHNEALAQPEPVRAAAKLTLNVRDVETDADVETGDGGALIGKIRNEEIKYVPPPIDLLEPQGEQAEVNDEELKENGRILQEKLATFDIEIEDLQVTPGPVVTLYEFVPAPGIKISRIESLADDIALALKARGIRIIAPIPGKGTVGVEIPNHKPAMVRIRSVLNTAKFRENNFRLPLALGKTTVGEVFCDDLAKMPHLLIAGATGSGKSVGVNAILTSLLYKMHPSDLKLVIIDPKKIEMTQYKALKDHFLARCPDIDEDIITQPANAVLALKSLEMEMDRRYDILAKVGQRNIFDYNQKVAEGKYADNTDFDHVKLPYIVLILDELADLMMTASREIEEPICRLAQLARAIGIHLIVATQRPSVNVITGVIKANFPARIAYQVASKIDSRTILDMNGAEYLLGNGDMLFLPGGMPKPMRLQNAFVSTEEVEEICEHIGRQQGYTTPYELPSVLEKTRKSGANPGGERDELFDEAARLVVQHQQGSVSLVQRRLKVGYSRAARIIDELEMAGVVGPFDGSKARAVLLESEAELEAFL
jgi:DNA segregation ATPase FtsK/SpoIIIE, S-DNA-T family